MTRPPISQCAREMLVLCAFDAYAAQRILLRQAVRAKRYGLPATALAYTQVATHLQQQYPEQFEMVRVEVAA